MSICLHECEPDAQLIVGDSVLAYLKGDKGDKGDPGPGFPLGGTTGQVLAKRSDEDCDTNWIDPPSGGISVDDIDQETLVIENGILKVNTTNAAELDNTRPITSSGVYVIVGNIESLLEMI